MLQTIAFDADDTLWENEQFYRLTEQEFRALLSDHADGDHLSERLLAAQKRNLNTYGFGIKGFVLSMIETAIEVTDGQVPTESISKILAIGRDLLGHPIELLEGAGDVLDALAGRYTLLLITKGDLFDQERKIAQSGLAEKFDTIEIVPDKNAAVYRRIFTRMGAEPHSTAMVGNSLKSDIVPVLELGAWGIFVPHALTWSLEHVEAPVDHERFRQIENLRALPDLLSRIP
ncbi:HAD family hydrolase [Hoeflea alexandrii]|uniref:HAD family hydrolase n=1 Tax=Hoeflea alexandrii TaxID=288436 RepID=UPI0022B04F88|nr:HAD family hydrolase [Hoeflea alexandrii]MCZ4288959.1 HAD family hydrolase [Hoeflea alexandrii]